MTTYKDVKLARRELMEAIYAIVTDSRIKIDSQLAQTLEEAWDKYDLTLIAFVCPEDSDGD